MSATAIVGSIPLIIVTLLYLYAGCVRLAMGGFPDPHTLPLPLYALRMFLWCPVVMLISMAPLAAVFLALSFLRPFAGSESFRRSSAALLCTSGLVLALIAFDPWNLFTWFMD